MSIPVVPAPEASEAESFPVFKTWKEYERVAMHFNDLLIRLRTQSLGGVAAFAAVAAIVIRSDVKPEMRWHVMAGAFGLVSLFWMAIWVLDFAYYNRLLLGAVKAIMEIEAASQSNTPLRGLNLSTRIEEAVGGSHQLAGSRGRWLFYMIVMTALVLGLIASVVMGFSANATGS